MKQTIFMHHILSLLIMLVVFVPGCSSVKNGEPDFTIPIPKEMAFDHYTLALTWQPGFCSNQTGKALCTAKELQSPRIGLHGLWASEPSALERQAFPVTSWWAKGCALYPAGTGALPWSRNLAEHVQPIVPANMSSRLIQHEYEKHMRCFGMSAVSVFAMSSQMRTRLADDRWGGNLTSHAGQNIRKADLLELFTGTHGKLPERALQFRCTRDKNGESILTELWFTLKPDKLAVFPDHQAFLPSSQQQDNCPSTFRLPR